MDMRGRATTEGERESIIGIEPHHERRICKSEIRTELSVCVWSFRGRRPVHSIHNTTRTRSSLSERQQFRAAF